MGRKRKSTCLELWLNGLHAGTWRVDSRGEHELTYDADWVDDDLGRPISLSMPLRPPQAPYRGDVVRNYFENLLPDSRAIRQRLQARFNTPSISAQDLLAEIGRDCAGGLMLLPEGQEPAGHDRITGQPLSDADIENILEKVPLDGRHAEPDDLRISIAGAQEKTALLRHDGRWLRPLGATPTTHILKLPLGVMRSGIDLTTSVENEWLCARILAAFGVPVVQGEIARFGAQKVLLVPRFDRRLAADRSWILRLPQEDFAQVEGVGPEQKYEADGGPGIERINDRLLGSAQSTEDRVDFLRTQVLFWMLAAIDGHAKNFSVFIEPRGRFRLTPRYDVLSAYPVMGHAARQFPPEKIRMAMAIGGKGRHDRWAQIRRQHFEQTAADCGLGHRAVQIIDDLVQATSAVLSEVTRTLPADFPDSVSTPVLAGLEKASKRLADDFSGAKRK